MKNSLLIGSGRWATHLAFDLANLGIPFRQWSRRHSKQNLPEMLASADRVWLAISDRALPGFVADELKNFEGTVVHFSGALNIPGTVCAHPLMSFGPHLYEPSFYRGIHYAVTGAADLSAILPLPNSFTILAPEEKALYHALCVMGGNLPVLLWKKAEEGLKDFGVPETAIRGYFQRISENYAELGPVALTGPIARGDRPTIEKNLSALDADPWKKVYLAFVEASS